jgi:hypothetical protein
MEWSGMKNIPWNINNMEWDINNIGFYSVLESSFYEEIKGVSSIFFLFIMSYFSKYILIFATVVFC